MIKNTQDDPIYLDYAACTPVDPHVVEAMLEWMVDRPGGHYARNHVYGRAVADRIEEARRQIAGRIGVQAHEIVFTSNATESNNLAILGLAAHLQKNGKIHIITHEVEHKSVLGPVNFLKNNGFRVTVIPAGPEGYITAEDIEGALTPQTGLVSIQTVNNELGTIQPVTQIAEHLRDRDIFFHTDAAQALGKIAFSASTEGIDMATISAQKCYGPRGIAALYVREGVRELMEPLLKGGSENEKLRPGSLPVALCAGFGAACELAVYKEAETIRLENLRNSFIDPLKAGIGSINIHEASIQERRAPEIVSLNIPGLSGMALANSLPRFAFGVRPHSHVIRSVSKCEQVTLETIRISFGRFTKENELEEMADALVKLCQKGKLKNETRSCKKAKDR